MQKHNYISNLHCNTSDDDLEALKYHAAHPKGKIGAVATKPINSEEELSLAYSPGVAAPVREIASNPERIYDYTAKGNSIAVITNGTAILGLGDLGPAASKPVMEGKAALFKKFANIDAIDLEIDAQKPEEFIQIVKSLEPTFGGINLEDIKSPDCFIIEKKLQSIMDIPVFHDDQHGTAIVIIAALISACTQTNRCIKKSKIVINGAGAAGLSCARLLTLMDVPKKNLFMCDIDGVLHTKRKRGIHEWHKPYLRDTNYRSITQVINDADIVIGLSVKNAFSSSMIATMNSKPIIFALANPDPEILPHQVHEVRTDAVIATGRSDFPNQVNNLLAFPYIFRGALDVRASKITDGMKLAAISALVSLAQKNENNALLPSIFDPRLVVDVAGAISKAAIKDGVAKYIE